MTKEVQFVLRLTVEEKRIIQRRANAYAKGNVSQWLRHAAICYVPVDGDLEKALAAEGGDEGGLDWSTW